MDENKKNEDYKFDEDFYIEAEHDEDYELEAINKKRKASLRLIGIITLVFFLVTFSSIVIRHYNLPSLDFLLKSNELSDNPLIANMQRAVVEINTNGRKGTGFNVEPQGTIITNYHVVEGKKPVSIRFSNGKIFSENSRIDFPEIDISILNINGDDLPHLNPDTSSSLLTNDNVTIIGNPLGIPRIVTEGKIIGTTILKDWEQPVLMIEGTIHHGSSGSPVIDKNGNVAAVIFATLSNSENDNNDNIIGVAVPIKYLKDNLH